MDWQYQLIADWDDQEDLEEEINALAASRRRPRRILTGKPVVSLHNIYVLSSH